jgi:pseudaminic acid cytidylyltransferase
VRLAIIPARGGSVRIPRKNIRPFFGKPIIAYSIELAKASRMFDEIIVSTDDAEIAKVANLYGADALIRPEGWDEIGTQEVAARVVEQLTMPRHVCVIYATAPLLTVGDLENGWQAMREWHPLFAFSVGTEPLRDAGAFYWGEGWAFAKRVPLIGPRTAMVPIPESRVCDINTMEDWRVAERLYAGRCQATCAAS